MTSGNRRAGFTLPEVALVISVLLATVATYGGYVNFGHVGLGPLSACSLTDGGVARAFCIGYPPVPFGNSQPIRDWFASRMWHPKTATANRRTVEGGTSRLTVRLQAVDSNDFVPLRKLSQRGLVVARLDANPEGAEELRYGIGGDRTAGKGYTSTFYLVIDRFSLSFWSFFVKWVSGAPSYPIANWTVWGQQTNGTLVPLKSGRFHWCRHAHAADVRKDPAQFIGCEDAQKSALLQARVVRDPRISLPEFATLRAALTQRSILDVALGALPADTARMARTTAIQAQFGRLLTPADVGFLADLTYDVEVSPAWFTCGIGCCSAEE